MTKHPYRTALTLMYFGALIVGALEICVLGGPAAGPLFAPAATALSTLGLYASAKSAFEKSKAAHPPTEEKAP